MIAHRGFIVSIWLLLLQLTLSAANVVSDKHLRSGQLRLRSLKKEDENPPALEKEDEVDDAATTAGSSSSSTSGEPADIVQLVPFDVQIAVTLNNGIQFADVASIVTEWFNRIYQLQLAEFGYTSSAENDEKQYATFTSVVLFNNGNDNEQRTRNLLLRQRGRRTNGELYTAKFKGGAVFSKDSADVQSVPENDVLLIQQMALLNDTSLLTMLQRSTAIGLGSAVVDVQAFLNPVGSSTESDSQTSDSPDKQLEIVIIVAIVVACVAFLFLLAAVFWAYLYDRSNQANRRRRRHRGDGSEAQSPRNKKSSRKQPKTPATTSTSKKSIRDRTDSSDTGDEHTPEEKNQERRHSKDNHDNNMMISPYPTIIDNSGAAEVQSVISDSLVSNSNMSGDISTSLSAYYRSGMGKVSSSEIYSARLQQQAQRGMLDDAGSVSSMESYGYSLGGDEVTTTTPHVVVVDPRQQQNYAIHDTRERIGGLPVEPDLGNVQIPDLDKELAELDVQLLSPNIQEILMNTNIDDDDDDLDPDVDLANYQMDDDDVDDEEEIETVMDDPPASYFRQNSHNVVDVDDVKADDEVNEYPQESI